MHLKSLTLRGFKSFASATTLHFEPGVTCVVGPNGSGKSNVVDALSWVMGEQGAKSLRGGKMEDVIFAGTAGRPPLGRAEVVLTIDNTDGALPIDYTEVMISRTMFRSGGSEYAINGQAARLLDVQELLSDSGIGREMHVIVGQGQLDTILQATPEIRRGFIEEAAGVLKHRKRKEKALRKLESTEANLNRLTDLVAELRRQLKPLGRQAEVARKAAVIQADLRDARARLLADDLTQLTEALEADLADEAAHARARARVEQAHARARQVEAEAETALAQTHPLLQAAQETWYALSALQERVRTTSSIAAERVRHAETQPDPTRGGRDPEALDREASQVRDEEHRLREDVDTRSRELEAATLRRTEAEAAHTRADAAFSSQLRAIADRREGLARLSGQVNALRSRLEASAEEVSRLAQRREDATRRGAQAAAQFAALELELGAVGDDEPDLDRAHDQAEADLDRIRTDLARVRELETRANQERGSLAARVEALELGLERQDGGAALLQSRGPGEGVLGQLASLVEVEPGWEVAVAAALGHASDAVAVSEVDVALDAVQHLRAEDLGRAQLLVAGPSRGDQRPTDLPEGARWLLERVTAPGPVQGALTRLLEGMVAVSSLDEARTLVTAHPDLVAVTREGDLLSQWYAAGGSGRRPSLLEVQAAVDEARAALGRAQQEWERRRFEVAQLTQQVAPAEQRLAAALEQLHASDARHNALAEQLGVLSQTAREAAAEVERLSVAMTTAAAAREDDQTNLAELTERLERASSQDEVTEADPSERDRLGAQARLARQEELECRLALRTAEEKVKAMAGRADALSRAAQHERQARARAQARAAQVRREAEAASAVQAAAGWLAGQVEAAREAAATQRREAEQERQRVEAALGVARREARDLARELEGLVAGAHRDEMGRIELRMRIEQLHEKALTELGLEPEALLDEYGPHRRVPVLTHPDGRPVTEDDDDPPAPVPFVRAEQEKRLRAAERNLQVLGRVNPLALEEFDAMQQRHHFLAEQLEDLRRTRSDLHDIVLEVDARVQQVFAAAYADVEVTFERVFARLFPGGEGKLVLTDPGDWLTTGVDVEARPAGKKVKRLSLLSGGERSLVAVAFLVSLFMARPSPFYILDEVEAALDDTNLGRLLGIYEELRERSQLLVITHQKRTMEIADALYGVTMRGDGVSTVVSQRLRESTAS